jgi:hypothetical protein
VSQTRVTDAATHPRPVTARCPGAVALTSERALIPDRSDGRCVFEQLSTATLVMRPGFITAELFELAGKAERDHAEEARLDEMKA